MTTTTTTTQPLNPTAEALGAQPTQPEAAKPIAAMTAADKEAAEALRDYGMLAEEISGDFFSLVVHYVGVKGCTFEGMETACPELKQINAYRSAKSTVRKALKNAVKLFDGEGNAKTKKALAKECAPAKDDAEDGKEVTTGKPDAAMTVHYTDAMTAFADTFKVLRADAEARARFSTEIRELARMLANDEAEAKAKAEAEAKANAAKAASIKAEAEAKAKAEAAKVAADAAKAAAKAAQPAPKISAKAAAKAAKVAAAKAAGQMYRKAA